MKNTVLCTALLILYCGVSDGQTYRILYEFGTQMGDGSSPTSPLIADAAGNLYGTTQSGGNADATCLNTKGCGTVFELMHNDDGTWTESVLYAFCSNYSSGLCLDGANPLSKVILDSSGNLYGTTAYGGSSGLAACGNGCGTVF
jgi:hypothetical protein